MTAERSGAGAFPIDIVYLWVDGNDSAWQTRHHHYKQLTQPNEHTTQTMTPARWRNNDELRYSLRSVEKYAPWINHIYIVTDNQIPAWLDTSNSKISIIDHTEIMPHDALPTFSSNAIENNIYKIEGLSEHFLFANDDMLFSAPVTPDMFFTAEGRTIVRLGRYNRIKIGHRGNYIKKVWHMQNLVREFTGRMLPYSPHHNIDAYRRSDFAMCVAMLPEEWKLTTYRRFRHDDNMHRSFVGYYTIATGLAEMRRVGRYDRISGIGNIIRATLTHRFATDSRRIQINRRRFDSYMKRYSPLMICVNDNERATDEDCRLMVEFLKEMFPEKSIFER